MQCIEAAKLDVFTWTITHRGPVNVAVMRLQLVRYAAMTSARRRRLTLLPNTR